jgi:tetratricopeptide (TPR) repeat protein
MTGHALSALVAGAVFAVLPIHTEAVSHTVGRAELLVAFFTLAAIQLLEPPAGGWPQAARWHRALVLAGVLLCVMAALGSKETGVAALLLVPLFDGYWRRQRTVASGKEAVRESAWVRYRVWPLIFVAAGAYVGLRYAATDGQLFLFETPSPAVNILVDTTPRERVCGILQIWGMYWAKTFWPSVLVLDYSPNAVAVAQSLLHPHVLIGLLALAGMVALSVTTVRRGQYEQAIWCVALLASYGPVSNTLVLVKTTFAERVWYFPSVWAAMLIAWVLCVTVPAVVSQTSPGRLLIRNVLLGATAVLLAAGVVRCGLRNAEWRDHGTVLAAAYRDHPDSANVLLMYGSHLAREGRYDEAIALFDRLLLIDLGSTKAHRAIGQTYLLIGDFEKAAYHLATAEAQLPGHPDTLAALAHARAALAQQSAEEVARLARDAAARPDDIQVLFALADALARAGRWGEALDRLEQAASRFPDDSRIWHRMAVIAAAAGEEDVAAAYYRHALERNAESAPLMVELAMLLLGRRADGDVDEAMALVAEAARLDPGNVQVQIAQAEVLVLQGRREAAAQVYRTIAESLPEGDALRARCMMRAEYLEK